MASLEECQLFLQDPPVFSEQRREVRPVKIRELVKGGGTPLLVQHQERVRQYFGCGQRKCLLEDSWSNAFFTEQKTVKRVMKKAVNIAKIRA